MNFCVLLIVFVLDSVDTSYSNDEVINDTCRGWARPTLGKNGTMSCVCGNTTGKIRCECSKFLKIMFCTGITYDNESRQLLAGLSPYACNGFSLAPINITYNLSATEFTKSFCDLWNREGLMCSRCRSDYGVPLYSYSYRCVKCDSHWYGWLKYFAEAYLPLTIFYILIAFFRISANSGPLNMVVFVSQIIASYSNLNKALNARTYRRRDVILLGMASDFFEICNLDFFRFNYKAFCVTSDWTDLDVIALDYIIGIYPIFLIFLTSCAVKVYDRFSCVEYLWNGLRKCLPFSNRSSSKNSIIDYFATFLLLSYVKIMNVSFDILLPTNLYNIHGDLVKTVLYYDASTEAFKGRHFWFGILAVVMLLLFNILPLFLLLIYPCMCFQKVLNSMSCRAHSLQIFMDSFQGCFSHTGRNYRYFAGVLLLTRFVILTLSSFSLHSVYYSFTSVLLITLGIVVLVCNPYKKKVENYFNSMLAIACGFAYTSFSFYQEDLLYKSKLLHLFGTGMLGYCSIHVSGAIVYSFFPNLFHKLKPKKQYRELVDSSLPHRLENMEQDTSQP